MPSQTPQGQMLALAPRARYTQQVRGLLLMGLVTLVGCWGTPVTRAAQPPADGACTADRWDTYGNDFFEEQCNHCHETTYKSQRNVQMLGWSIIDTISNHRMPPKDSPPLTEAEMRRVLAYLRCKAP